MIAETSAKTVLSYVSRGMRFGSFYSPEDSDVFARVARRAARQTQTGLILDLGCGSGIPTIHACPTTHTAIGIDSSEEAISIAAENVRKTTRKVSFFRADMFKCVGNFSLVMSNPPYIPAAYSGGDSALEVQGSGSEALERILLTYGRMSRDFVFHFASISNPLRVLEAAIELDLRINYLELTDAPFGPYTSARERFNYIVEGRENQTAFFHCYCPTDISGENSHQLLMTLHLTRRKVRGKEVGNIVVSEIEAILQAFQQDGTNATARVIGPRLASAIKLRRFVPPSFAAQKVCVA